MDFPEFLKVAALYKLTSLQINESTVLKRDYKTFDLKLIDVLSKALHFSYKLSSPDDAENGRVLPDGNWTGLVGMVKKGEVDIAVSTLVLTEPRAEAVPCSYPYGSVELTFATRKPEYNPDITGFLRPFSFSIWLSLTLCIFTIPFVFFMVTGKKYSFVRITFSVFGSLLQEHLVVIPKTVPQYFAVTGWLLGMMFLSYIYTALLLSFMTFPSLNEVRTISQLSKEVAKGNYQCMTYPGSFIIDAFVKSGDTSIQEIGRDLLKNEASRDVVAVLQKDWGSKKPAFVGGMIDFLPLKEKYFVSEDIFFPTFLTILMRPGFCCQQKMDKIVSRFWAAGLYSKILRDNSFATMLKLNNRIEFKVDSERGLAVEDFKGPFISLFAGLMLSLIALVLELFFHNIIKKC